MVAFLNRHYEFMHSANIEIIATGTTGKHAQDAGLKLNAFVRSTREMPNRAQVAEHKVQMVLFFAPAETPSRTGCTNVNARL
ncbi:MAG: hypothetical protein ACLTZT_15840 [Butyricimonas faecalis]